LKDQIERREKRRVQFLGALVLATSAFLAFLAFLAASSHHTSDFYQTSQKEKEKCR
jgi:hypothetical protein